MRSLSNLIDLLGRILFAPLFFPSGIHKITGYAATQHYMASHGVSPQLLFLAIILEVAGPILLIIGWQTRWVAFIFAVYCCITAYFFHFDIANPLSGGFVKDLALAGGMLILAGRGPGDWSIDGRPAED